MIGKHERKLCIRCLVVPGGVKQAAMKEQHVAGVELDPALSGNHRLIAFNIRTQKKRVVDLLGRKVNFVRTGKHQKTAILEILASEREPDRDQLGTREGPVAYVLMPVRDAAVARILRHDAVVMRLRQLDTRTQQLTQTLGQTVLDRPVRDEGITRARL